MIKSKNYYTLLFAIVIFMTVLASIYIFTRRNIYQRQNTSSGIVEISDGWILEVDGLRQEVSFPLDVSLEQGQTAKLYYEVGDEFSNYNEPALRFYKYYVDMQVFDNGSVIYSSVDEPRGVSNTKGSSDLIIALPDSKVGDELEFDLTATINGNFMYNFPVPYLGDNSDLYYELYSNTPLQVYFNVIMVTTGIIIMFLYLLFRKVDNLGQFLNVGVFAMIVGAYLIVSTRWYHGITNNPYLTYLLEYSLFMACSWPILKSIIDVSFGYSRRFAEIVLDTQIGLFVIAYILLFVFKIELVKILPAIHFTLMLAVVAVIVNSVHSVKFENEEGIRMSKSFFALAVGIVLDVILFYVDRNTQYMALFSELGLMVFIIWQLNYSYGNYNQFRIEKYRSEIYRQLAFEDALTGAGSRIAYENEIDKINRSKSEYSNMWAASIDLNNLKYYNDSYGHAAGDELLRNAVEILKKALRTSDKLYRIGGDEFIILLRNYNAEQIAEFNIRMNRYVREFNRDSQFKLGYAIGYSKFNPKAEQLEDTIAIADNKMYEDKRNKQPMS